MIDARDFLDSVAGYANSSVGGPRTAADRPVLLGTVDQYYTAGLARVLLDGETILSQKGYTWASTYTPVAGERVFLLPVGQSYIIGGSIQSKVPYSRYHPIPLQNGWVDYDSWNYHAGSFTKTSDGVVKLAGLIKNGAVAQGTIIGKLPVGFRPDVSTLFPVMSNGVYGSVRIDTNGDIVCEGYTHAAWVSLDNIIFPTANLSWTVATLSSPFTITGNNKFGRPSYAIDAQNRVWLRGAFTAPSTPAADATILNLPAGLRPAQQIHIPTSSSTGGVAARNSGLIGVADNGNVLWKQDTPNLSYMSLGGVMFAVPATGSWTNATYTNGWGSYLPSAFPAAGYRQDADGTVHLRGLISGPRGSSAFALPPGMRPAKITLRVTQSANTTARIDINPDGGVVPSGGSDWFSIDGVSFTAEQ